MESEQFRNIKDTITRELHRTEENKERNRIRLRELQEGYEREIEKEFESERERLDNEGRELDQREQKLSDSRKHFNDSRTVLEDEYNRKRKKVGKSSRKYKSPEQCEIGRIERRIRKIESTYINPEERISAIRIKTETIDTEIIRLGEIEGRILEDITNEYTKKDNCEREFEELRGELNRRFQNEDFEPTSPLGQRIKEIIKGGKLLAIIESDTIQFNELDNARKIIKSKTWRDWDWS